MARILAEQTARRMASPSRQGGVSGTSPKALSPPRPGSASSPQIARRRARHTAPQDELRFIDVRDGRGCLMPQVAPSCVDDFNMQEGHVMMPTHGPEVIHQGEKPSGFVSPWCASELHSVGM